MAEVSLLLCLCHCNMSDGPGPGPLRQTPLENCPPRRHSVPRKFSAFDLIRGLPPPPVLGQTFGNCGIRWYELERDGDASEFILRRNGGFCLIVPHPVTLQSTHRRQYWKQVVDTFYSELADRSQPAFVEILRCGCFGGAVSDHF